MKRPVAIVGSAQLHNVRSSPLSDAEMLNRVVREAAATVDLNPQTDIGFVCFGSADYLTGVPFSFVRATDCYPAWPPMSESHLEMDGAFALYEAVMRLQHGDIDTALVYSFGKSSLGDLTTVLTLQMDPYFVAPLRPDSISIAALQAALFLAETDHTEEEMANVASANRRRAMSNPFAQLRWDRSVDELLVEPYLVQPLRRHDCPPISDGAAAVVLAVGDRARDLCERPAWIRGIDHRIESQHFGLRDLAHSPSTAAAARNAGADKAPIDVAEIHAPFSHQELIVLDALRLNAGTDINPSGGALAANPIMSAGLLRIIEAAESIISRDADRALAHATSGPCLQQNLVAVLEGD